MVVPGSMPNIIFSVLNSRYPKLMHSKPTIPNLRDYRFKIFTKLSNIQKQHQINYHSHGNGNCAFFSILAGNIGLTPSSIMLGQYILILYCIKLGTTTSIKREFGENPELFPQL